jgi:Spy/CpxP family protein refolding chaperone
VNSWKVILATMVIFGAGVVTGGLLVGHADRLNRLRPPRNPAAARPQQPVSPGGTRFELLRRMGRELKLTPEQQERADHIIKEAQEHTKKIMEPVAPKMREEFQRTTEGFRELLTPEQRARFDELLKQQQRPRGEQRHSPPSRERPLEAAPSAEQRP